MFYCNDCRIRRAWPKSASTSIGPCEVCQETCLCYDRPVGTLTVQLTSGSVHPGACGHCERRDLITDGDYICIYCRSKEFESGPLTT